MCHLKNIFHYINIELKGGVFFVVVTKPSPLPLPSLPIFPLAVLDFEIDRKMLGVARRKLGFGLFSATVGEYQGAYKISKGLLEKYGPDRVLDTPITEQGNKYCYSPTEILLDQYALRVFFYHYKLLNLCPLQAIDHIINSAAKSNYMSAGQISVPIVFRGPNGAAAGVGAQHSQLFFLKMSYCISMSVMEESFEYLDAPVERIAGADVPMPYAANLERMAVPQVIMPLHSLSEIMVLNCFLQVDDIVRATKRACYRSVPMAAAA
ncbi:hypothetical protein BHM03_00008616 [Ensete ventricosum]|nr:hypothetical protein BHM03_00008616 [Ensete ventricosum]